MSAAPNEPTPSPLPFRSSPAIDPKDVDKSQVEHKHASLARPKPSFPSPKLRLKIQDLNHPATSIFLKHSEISKTLHQAVDAVLSILYQPTNPNDHIPPTRSVTLILRAMDGVAYTTGSDMDDDDKMIHLSLSYVEHVATEDPEADRIALEVQGVLVHEMVHCWQWNGLGSAPGGLIEGIADFVRMQAGLSASHWKKESGGKWDAGYQYTGYFLEWIVDKYGEASVRRINYKLQGHKYVEEVFWKELFGKKIEDLWKDYLKTLEEGKPKEPEKNAESGYLSVGDLVEKEP